MGPTCFLILVRAVIGQTPTWIPADPYLGPRDSPVHSVVEMPSRNQIIALTDGGNMLLWDGQQWRPHSPPYGTGGWGRMAYDSLRDVVVKVGPRGETHEWDGTTWYPRQTGPSGGGGIPSLTYDVAYHPGIPSTIWYGTNGCQPGYTARWNGQGWGLSGGGPVVGISPRMAYDPGSGFIVMYGGMDAACFLPTDVTWLYDGANWSRQMGPGPGVRVGPALGYDRGRGALVLHGGKTIFWLPPGFRDTWLFSVTGWQNLVTGVLPPVREDGCLAFDHARNRLLVFGGELTQQVPNFDTWWLLDRVLVAPSSVRPGQIATIGWTLPGSANRPYGMAASFGTFPGIALPDNRLVPLNVDGLFVWSFLSQAPPFVGFAGVLDASGRGTAALHVPVDARLSGIRFFVAGITLQGNNVGGITNEERITIL